jgi:hypothetical protein
MGRIQDEQDWTPIHPFATILTYTCKQGYFLLPALRAVTQFTCSWQRGKRCLYLKENGIRGLLFQGAATVKSLPPV